MICNTLGKISSGLNFGADALLTGAAVAGGVGGVLAINIEGGPISEGGAAVSFVTAGVLAVGGGEGKVLSWANTWAANKFGGCSISY
jgi:hypothetical protein